MSYSDRAICHRAIHPVSAGFSKIYLRGSILPISCVATSDFILLNCCRTKMALGIKGSLCSTMVDFFLHLFPFVLPARLVSIVGRKDNVIDSGAGSVNTSAVQFSNSRAMGYTHSTGSVGWSPTIATCPSITRPPLMKRPARPGFSCTTTGLAMSSSLLPNPLPRSKPLAISTYATIIADWDGVMSPLPISILALQRLLHYFGFGPSHGTSNVTQRVFDFVD
ncbi:hypothetical protein CR513_46476, partial [Mucuna pruriens]